MGHMRRQVSDLSSGQSHHSHRVALLRSEKGYSDQVALDSPILEAPESLHRNTRYFAKLRRWPRGGSMAGSSQFSLFGIRPQMRHESAPTRALREVHRP